MSTTKRNLPKTAIWAMLLAIPVALAVFLALRPGQPDPAAMLSDVDDGIALGDKAANAVAAHHARSGKYPASLDELAEKIAPSAAADIAVDPQTGEVTVTLKNKRFAALQGKKMYFKTIIIAGQVIRVQCRPGDEEFKRLFGDRCS